MTPPLPTRIRGSRSAAVGAVRTALPLDPLALPALPSGFEAALEPALRALEVELTPGARAAITGHVQLLLAWTAAINLSAIRDPAQLALAHVADSLAGLPLLRRSLPAQPALLDLGSGGGFPGLPLAIVLPAGRLALVDSIGKKARFLEVAATAVRAAQLAAGEPALEIEVHAVLAEALAEEPAQRASWDVVTARAVGSIAEVAELGLPLLRRGGRLVAWKRDRGDGALERELAAAEALIRAAGGGRPEALAVTGPGADPALAVLAEHRLVVLVKESATPRHFPRSPAERRRLLR
ncbi:MAG: 16S rRNA (guanine(527)-N(7))-methyltransferase RsmG [Candidatus Limnocylindrales bacterium]